MESNEKRGFVLLSVLFFVLVVGMYSRVILKNGPVMAALADQASQELLAQRAAEAGASYARAMLREDGDWKGDENRVTVNEPDLIIQEDNGNVVGWMTGGNNQVAMFRFRFNYQDGAAVTGVGDELDDPSTLFIDNVYASYSNASGSLGGPSPVVGDVNPSTFAVDDPTVGSIEVPPGNVVVRVEGLAGRGVQDATGPTFVPPPGAPVLKRVLRVVYAASPDPDIPDTAFSAGGGLATEISNAVSVQIIGTGTAKMRSKKGVDIKNWDGSLNTLSMTGEVGRDPTLGLNGNYAGIAELDETVGDGNDFHNIPWSDVPIADTDETAAVQLPGGIYVVDATGDYYYYDMSLADYEALPPNPGGFRPGGTLLGRNFEEVRSPANLASPSLRNGWQVDSAGFKIQVDRDVNITTSSNGIDDFTITTLSGRKFEENDTNATNPYLFSGVDPSYAPLGALTIRDSIISSKGDLALMTDVRSRNGSLTSEGDVYISAPSVRLEVSSGAAIRQRLSVYSKGDLTMSTYLKLPPNPYVGSYESYGNLDLEGLIYTWGDTNIYAGTPGQDPNSTIGYYGDITIEGALISYGGDPAAFDGSPTTGPGSDVDGGGNAKGKINLFGRNADIKYDRTKLVTDPSVFTNTGLPAVDRLSYGFER